MTDLRGSLRTEVLHFERLSHRVFQEVGGLNEEQLSKAATEMMIMIFCIRRNLNFNSTVLKLTIMALVKSSTNKFKILKICSKPRTNN